MWWASQKTKVSSPSESQLQDLLERGVVEAISATKIKELLSSGKMLRIKFGIDPTSPNIHLGRAVPLRKLKVFQELGHQIVFIIGDFTGVIGDTSDKDSERPMLSDADVSKNLKTYFEQAGKVLDMSFVEKKYNSEWLSKLSYKEIAEQADSVSVADFIARENIKRRLDKGSRVSLRETLYPLMQGYDSVAVKADIEIGGIDQKFNLLAGRHLQEKYKMPPQQVLMSKLLIGTDGRKMSSSWGNSINLTDSADDMFGKVMRIPDEYMEDYFVLATNIPLGKIKEFTEAIKNGENPKKVKLELARTIVGLYHGPNKAVEAEKNFEQVFSKGEVPEQVLEYKVKEAGEKLKVSLKNAGVIKSGAEFDRLVTERAISSATTARVVEDPSEEAQSDTYKVGKRRFIKIVK